MRENKRPGLPLRELYDCLLELNESPDLDPETLAIYDQGAVLIQKLLLGSDPNEAERAEMNLEAAAILRMLHERRSRGEESKVLH